MIADSEVEVDYSTSNRWVLKYILELDKRLQSHLKPTNDSWRLDETYIKLKGEWKYLYRAVDSAGDTLDFILMREAGWQSSGMLLSQSFES